MVAPKQRSPRTIADISLWHRPFAPSLNYDVPPQRIRLRDFMLSAAAEMPEADSHPQISNGLAMFAVIRSSLLHVLVHQTERE